MLSTHTHSTARQHPYPRPNANSIPESPTPTSTPATNTPPFRPPPPFQPLQAPPSMSFGDLFHKPLPNYLLPNDKDHQLMSSLNHQPSPPTNQDYQQPISLSIYPNHHFSLYPNQPINSSSHPPPPFSNRSSSNSSSSPNSSTANNNLHSFTPPKHQHLTPTSDQLFSELIPAHPPPPPQQQQQPPIEHHHLNQAAYLFHQSELLNAFSATPSPTDLHHINTLDNQSSPHSSPLLDLSAYSLWPTADPLPTESKLSGAESLFQQQPDLTTSFYSLQPPPVSSDQTQTTDSLPIPIPIPIPQPPPPSSSGNTTQYKLIDQSHHHHTHNFQPEPTTSLSNLHHHHHLNQPIPECQTTAEESGHNAVEKRYRNNINSHIAALADLVPALHHLRSLPSAATSRRHSSQFIVSTSAIGKIPSGLVDGVKAATKLSKGNILSKSVDYVKHLLRTRSEMLEDVEELKTLIKYRVEGGQILVLEWEEKVNAKVPERERSRLMDQSQGEEDLDEEEDQKQSNPQPQQQPPLNKKRKAAGVGGGGRRGVGVVNKEVVPVVIDELEVFRQPSSASDAFGSAAAVPYPTDFVPGNHFGQNYHPGHQSRRFGGLPASNMLAASMGLSFAAGSAYHYYSYPSSASPRPAEAQEASQIISDQRQITPGSSASMFKAGLDTVSLASIVFVLVVLLRPDFLVNFVGTEKGLYGKNRKKRRTKVLDSDSEEEDGARKAAEEVGLGSWLRELSGQVLTGTRADEKAVVGEAEVDSLLDPRDRRSVLRRALTSFKLYCLIDWNRRPQARHVALLSLHLRTVLGSQNLLSKKLWDQARASSTAEPDYVHEALQSTFIETCSLLSTSLKQSAAISSEPLMRIVERKSELQLIEIWSRILVSAMRKTCPIQVCSTRLAKNFKLDTIDGLPTRVEEAGDAYALQITAARELVDRSIDRISSIGIDRLSPIGSLARLTKGVWALAFARTHVAREVAEELQKENAWAAVVPYLNLVLGETREMKQEEQQQQRGVMTRLEKLATVTICWLSLRKSHLIINVLPNQTWFEESDITTINQSNSRLVIEGLVKQAEDLKSLIAADPVLETDTDLVNGSVKQSVEAVKGGESREYDLIRALTDCSHNVDVVWKIGMDRLDHLIKDGGMDSSS